MSAIPLCDLFRRCVDRRGGDAWKEFVRRCECGLRRAVWRAFRRDGVELSKHDLDEVVQELYCRLLTVRRFRGRSELELWAYLTRVAKNLAIDHRRAARAGKRRMEVISAAPITEDPWEWLVSSADSPEQRFLESERWRVFLARCAAAAPGKGRAIVLALRMALLEGWSSREIAAELDGALSAGQIDSLICRLSQRLAEEGLAVPRRRGGWRPAC